MPIVVGILVNLVTPISQTTGASSCRMAYPAVLIAIMVLSLTCLDRVGIRLVLDRFGFYCLSKLQVTDKPWVKSLVGLGGVQTIAFREIFFG